MIVVRIELLSARGEERDADLGTMVIDNITTLDKLTKKQGRVCDYRCRMYRRGALDAAGLNAGVMTARAKHMRETVVSDHKRHAEPVQNLVAKALAGMGYR